MRENIDNNESKTRQDENMNDERKVSKPLEKQPILKIRNGLAIMGIVLMVALFLQCTNKSEVLSSGIDGALRGGIIGGIIGLISYAILKIKNRITGNNKEITDEEILRPFNNNIVVIVALIMVIFILSTILL